MWNGFVHFWPAAHQQNMPSLRFSYSRFGRCSCSFEDVAKNLIPRYEAHSLLVCTCNVDQINLQKELFYSNWKAQLFTSVNILVIITLRSTYSPTYISWLRNFSRTYLFRLVPPKAWKRSRQCRMVLWIERVCRCLFELRHVSARRKGKHVYACCAVSFYHVSWNTLSFSRATVIHHYDDTYRNCRVRLFAFVCFSQNSWMHVLWV